jgi:superoxide dismutase
MGKNDEDFKQEGIQGLLTPEAYNISWTDYQNHLIDVLNTRLAGMQNNAGLPILYTV